MKKYLLLLILIPAFMGCEEYDDALVPLVGVYEGVLVGEPGVFTMSVSVEGNDLIIDAPFDGFTFGIIESNVRNEEQEIIDLDFCGQELYPDVFICGDGFYNYGDIQLSYELDFGFGIEEFIIVATKL